MPIYCTIPPPFTPTDLWSGSLVSFNGRHFSNGGKPNVAWVYLSVFFCPLQSLQARVAYVKVKHTENSSQPGPITPPPQSPCKPTNFIIHSTWSCKCIIELSRLAQWQVLTWFETQNLKSIEFHFTDSNLIRNKNQIIWICSIKFVYLIKNKLVIHTQFNFVLEFKLDLNFSINN